jgi:threonine dehydrogenase-like Zn-dependent dehydrogenase
LNKVASQLRSEVIVKALAWHGKGDIRCEDVPDPRIEHPRDAIIKVSACAICGSDLHIYGGIIPSMQSATSSAMRAWGKSWKSVRTTRR